MAVNNTLAKAKPQQAANVTEYESNGEIVKLSPDTIRAYLVNGGGEVTNQEVMMFLSLCRFQHLNPFLKEAYLIKYGSSPATIVTGKDVFTKRAKRNKDYAGKQAGIIVKDLETGDVIEREGTFYQPGAEQILGGWAKVYIKGYERPEYAAVSFDEYAGKTKDGKLNSQWTTRPATMIRKVALVQALREAFPEDYAGMVSPEEIPAANSVIDDAAPIIKTAATATETPENGILEPGTVNTPPETQNPVETPESALFG